MRICPSVTIKTSSNKVYQLKSTRNPIDLYKMMKMYSKQRKELFPLFRAVVNSLDSMFNNCSMRVIKDDIGNLLAAYTYRFRKNRLEQKSLYIDALVRNFDNLDSKNLIDDVYTDMKNIAHNRNAQELTLFSKADERALRGKYEKLGFIKDEKSNVFGGYIMRVKTEEFLT